MKILQEEPYITNLLCWFLKDTYTYTHIYTYKRPGWSKNTQVAWQNLSINKPSETLHYLTKLCSIRITIETFTNLKQIFEKKSWEKTKC